MDYHPWKNIKFMLPKNTGWWRKALAKSALFSVRAFDFESSRDTREKVNEYREKQLDSSGNAVGELEQISSTTFVNLFSMWKDPSDQGNVTYLAIFGQLDHNFWSSNFHWNSYSSVQESHCSAVVLLQVWYLLTQLFLNMTKN